MTPIRTLARLAPLWALLLGGVPAFAGTDPGEKIDVEEIRKLKVVVSECPAERQIVTDSGKVKFPKDRPCSVKLQITVRTVVEEYGSGFDKVTLNDQAVTSSYGSNGCGMHVETKTLVVEVSPDEPKVTLAYDTMDGHFNKGARAEVKDVEVLDSTCGSTSGSCSVGGGSVSNKCVNVSIPLRESADAPAATMILLNADEPGSGLYSPAALVFHRLSAATEVISTAAGALRQILTAQTFIDVVTPADPQTYEVRFYPASAAGAKDSSGLYTLVSGATPYETWRFTNPVPADTNSLAVTRLHGEDVIGAWTYQWVPADNGWTLTSGTGADTKVERRYTSTGGQEKTYGHQILDGNSNTLLHEQTVTQTFAWGEEVVRKVVDPDGAALTTLYYYYDNQAADGDNYGQLKGTIEANGNWARYEYDSEGRVTKTVTPFGNAPWGSADALCRVVTQAYQDNAPQETTSETVLGVLVARNWLVREQATTDYSPYGGLFLNVKREKRIRAAAPANAWDNVANPATVTDTIQTATNLPGLPAALHGQVCRVINSDGTATFRTFAYGANTTVTETRGALAADGLSVADGTRTVTVTNWAGQQVSTAEYDIASGLQLSGSTQSAFDASGRATRIDYADGTCETLSYACCGLASRTGRDGIVTSYTYDTLGRNDTQTTAGLTTRYTYDALGRTLQTERLGTDNSAILQNTSTYDSAGRLTASADALGNPTTYAEVLNADGTRTTTTTNPDGTTQVQTINRDGTTATVTGTAVHPLKYEYGVDTDGLYAKTISIGANDAETEWTTGYTDFLGRGYKTVTASGAVSQTYYNALGQQVRAVDPDGVTTLYAYNAKGEQEYAAIDMNGNDQIDFSSTDRITRTQSAVLTAHGTTVRRTTSSVWTASGETEQAVRDASADGHQQWNTSFGQTTATEEVIVPATATRTVTVTRPDGTRLVSVTQNGRALSETQYDSASNVVASQTRTYDAHGRVATETDSRGLVTSYVYDNADRTTSVTRAGGGLSQTTAYVYDTMGRITETTLPDGGTLYQTYWPDGQPRRKWGAREYPSETAYDIQGRRVTLTTWQDFTNTAGAAVTTWAYDAVTGRLSQKLYPDGKGPAYTYTPAGRLLTRTWARGIVTTYGHTVAGDPSTIDYANTTGTDVSYAYDRQGRQTGVTDATGARAITYTAAGQPDTVTYTGGPLDGIALDYAQDALNRPAGYAATMGTQTVASASYGYDTAGRLGTVTAGNDTFAYSYIQSSGSLVGGITAQHNGNTVMTTTKSYDGLNRLTAISQQVGGNVVSSHTYIYNQADQRTRATREDGAYWDYSYDALGQVIGGVKKTAAGQAIPGMNFGYSYDDIGNRKTSTTGVPAHESTYTANLLNQYTQRTVSGWFDLLGSANPAATVSVTSPADSASPAAIHATDRSGAWWHAAVPAANSNTAVYDSLKVTGVLKGQGADGKDIVSEQTGHFFVPHTPETFTYDDDGNLTADGRWTYSWDGENRLVAMETKSGIGVSPMMRLVFAYDAQARRVSKQVYNWTSGAWALQSETRFLYDGWNLVAEFAVDPVTQARTLKTNYVWGLDLSGSLQGAGGVGGLQASTIAITGATNYFCYDGNGDVAGLINAASGAESARYDYDPFGNTLAQSGTMAIENPFRFSSKYQDKETGFYYYGYRYYHPKIGRWPSRDLINEIGFQFNTSHEYWFYSEEEKNLYNFAKNCTISYSDAQGLCCTITLNVSMPERKAISEDNTLNAAIDTGHTWLVLTKEDGTVDNFSFGPKRYLTRDNIISFISGEMPGATNWPFHGDIIGATKSWTLDADKCAIAKKLIDDLKKTVPNYTTTYQCTVAALGILNAIPVSPAPPSGIGHVVLKYSAKYGSVTLWKGDVANPHHLGQQMKQENNGK